MNNVHHVHLFASDIEKSLSFYRDARGGIGRCDPASGITQFQSIEIESFIFFIFIALQPDTHA